MKPTLPVFTLAALAVFALQTPASAEDRQGHRSHKMERMHGGDRGPGRALHLFELYDTNADGTLTQEEINAARAGRLAEFDTNSDNALSLAEYEALWLDAMRERMVDRFQSHDDDGDGLVTAEEFGEQHARIIARMDRNNDGVVNADDLRQRRRGAAPAE